MTLAEMKAMVMYQTNNDADDLGDFEPYLDSYLNEGYDKLVQGFLGVHIGNEAMPRLLQDTDAPRIPDWCHRAIADYATWMVYRNGTPNKQNRGYAYRTAFEEMYSEAVRLRGKLEDKDGDGSYETVTTEKRSFFGLYPPYAQPKTSSVPGAGGGGSNGGEGEPLSPEQIQDILNS
ncbi:MAG: hypothetical protein PHY12_12290 [Eubacteriales bacterium]|nr:hypothetical protein [Eubacteriales bacterium]